MRDRWLTSLVLSSTLVACGLGERAPANASVTVTDHQGVPRAGVDVVFHLRDGTPSSHQVTDEQGRTHDALEAGGLITVVTPELVTFTGIEDGDDIHLGASAAPANPVIGTLSVSLPALAGALQYRVDVSPLAVDGESPCHALVTDASPIMLEVRARCVVDGKVDVVAMAFDGEGRGLAASIVREVDWTASLHVDLPAWSAPATVEVVTTNPPPGTDIATVYGVYGSGPGRVKGPFEQRAVSPPGPPVVVAYPPGFAGLVTLHVSKGLHRRSSTLPGTLVVDLGATLLPRWPDGWRAGPPAADGAMMESVYTTDNSLGTWTMVASVDHMTPAGVGTLVSDSIFDWPPLPPELAAKDPFAQPGLRWRVTYVDVYDADWVSGYHDFLRHPDLDNYAGADPDDVPLDGVLRTASWLY